jgi:HEAT repeat protein
MIVLVRVGDGMVDRLRTFTPNCEIDAGDMPMTWLDGVTPDASATWLTTVIRSSPGNGANPSRDNALLQPAMSALELNPGRVALDTLVGFARDDTRPTVRSRALTALAQRAEQDASATIQNAINNDPDTEVKKTAVGALARMPKDEGIPLLIQVARTNRNVDVRKQAMFWLGESKDPRAVTFFEEILQK